MDFEKLPPLMKQYFQLQQEYPDYFIFMEIGSFYEIMQIGDLGWTKKACEVADLTLTSKNKKKKDAPLMAGFPTHTAEGYFKKIVEAGYRLVVVSQKIEHQDNGKKKVSRYIEKIISPGVVVENISEEKANYFACLYPEYGVVGVALIDVSTGEVKITEVKQSNLVEYLDKVKPAEILMSGEEIELSSEKYRLLKDLKHAKIDKLSSAGTLLKEYYNLKAPTSDPKFALSLLGIERWKFGSLALSNLINYIASTDYNINLLKKLSKPKVYNEVEFLTIPLNGYRSLEVFDSMNSYKDTLVYTLETYCKTAMGRRKLRDWMTYPLIDIKKIEERYDRVAKYLNEGEFYPQLKEVYDVQRLSRRLLLSRLLPHEILHFYDSLEVINEIFKQEKLPVAKATNSILTYLKANIDFSKVENGQVSEFEFFTGKLLDKVATQCEQVKAIKTKAFQLKHEYEQILQKASGQTERQFFRLEKKKDNFQLVGAKGLVQYKDLVSLSAKTNSTEVISPEWKKTSDQWLFTEMKYLQSCQVAWQVFQKELMAEFGDKINEIAECISEIDVLTNFAQLTQERDYHRPRLINSSHASFDFKTLRHPVVERSSYLKDDFIPNDASLTQEKDIMVIYGANSAGKSTILKSVALNMIMAQMGCFVAAAEGSCLTPFEAILTRMTTFDSLSEGLSTFTMEMKELQTALRYTKQRSLFLLDEIGRGTSVEDGEAIAFATLEYLSQEKNNSVAFFATHYHNLAPEIAKYQNIDIKNMDCWLNEKHQLVFSRKLKDGPGSGSYGIDVAASCGLPEELIRVAKNYNKLYAPLRKSRYNSQVEGMICPLCEKNPVQDTHHLIDQKQGKVKEVEIRGIKRPINHKENLVMICASCHRRVTNGEIKLIKE